MPFTGNSLKTIHLFAGNVVTHLLLMDDRVNTLGQQISCGSVFGTGLRQRQDGVITKRHQPGLTIRLGELEAPRTGTVLFDQ
ncbi:hypothetical protein D3C76_1361340 [compost metagenome]